MPWAPACADDLSTTLQPAPLETAPTMNAPLPDAIRQALERVTLDDKYALESGRAFMSGVQALVRLPMLQRARDAKAGLNTAGFVSGYRGSPLGGYDQALWAAKKHLAEHHRLFGRFDLHFILGLLVLLNAKRPTTCRE